MALVRKALLGAALSAAICSTSMATVYFQNNGDRTKWPNYPQNPQAKGTISNVSSPTFHSTSSIHFTQTWIPNYTGRYHSEVDYQGTQFTNQDRYYGMALYLPSSWSTNDSKASVQQWAGDGPWIIMEVRGSNLVILPHIAGITTIGGISRGSWMRIVFHLLEKSSGGKEEIWLNGSKKVSLSGNTIAPATNGNVRWSAGLYVTGWTGVTSQPNPSFREDYETHYRVTSSYAEAEPNNW